MAKGIADLVSEKEKAYGSAFDKAGDFLKVLYPNGIKSDQYKDMLCIVRVFDKLMRIATSYQGTEEKKIDAYSDMMGYALLGLRSSLIENNLPKFKSEEQQAIANEAFEKSNQQTQNSPSLQEAVLKETADYISEHKFPLGTSPQLIESMHKSGMMTNEEIEAFKKERAKDLLEFKTAQEEHYKKFPTKWAALAKMPAKSPESESESTKTRWAELAFGEKSNSLPGKELHEALKQQVTAPEFTTRFAELAFETPINNRPTLRSSHKLPGTNINSAASVKVPATQRHDQQNSLDKVEEITDKRISEIGKVLPVKRVKNGKPSPTNMDY
jgi:hypothetical protein